MSTSAEITVTTGFQSLATLVKIKRTTDGNSNTIDSFQDTWKRISLQAPLVDVYLSLDGGVNIGLFINAGDILWLDSGDKTGSEALSKYSIKGSGAGTVYVGMHDN